MPYQIDFEVKKCDWDAFIIASPQANIFSTSKFLDSLGCRHEFVFLYDAGEPVLAAVIMIGPDGRALRSPHKFSLYQGIAFSAMHGKLPLHRRIKNGLNLLDEVLQACAHRYGSFVFSLHHAIEDLRAFQWFNYHSPEQGTFSLQLSYTGVIDIAAVASFEEYLSSIREVKRQEYRKGAKLGVRRGTVADIDILVHLHRLTFERQGLSYDVGQEKLIRSITAAALENDYGDLLICDATIGEPAAATVFLRDRATSYYLFGANNPLHRKTGAGSFLTIENIRMAYAAGLQSVDLVGINSPNRGDFKTSLNALPKPYFTASLTLNP